MATATVMDMVMVMGMAMLLMIIKMIFLGLENCGVRLAGLLEEGKNTIL